MFVGLEVSVTEVFRRKSFLDSFVTDSAGIIPENVYKLSHVKPLAPNEISRCPIRTYLSID